MKRLNFQSFISSFRSVGWRMAALLLTLKFAGVALATQPIYQNFSVLNYVIPGNPPPTIDATNFDNENQFNISFDELTGNAQFYEPENTVNYTNRSTGINTGIMTASSTNGQEVGFQFDTLTTNTIPHQMAGTFYNSGTIRCASFLDGNFGNIGQCLVWATNIICPGDIDASADGFLNLSGQKVDLSRSVLTLESPENLGIAFGDNAPFTGTGTFGTDTNTWDPSAELLNPFNPPGQVESGFFGIPPFFLFLTNAVPFATNNVDPITQNNVYKFVYIQDTSSSNVAYSVYLDTGASTLLGNGEATIQWTGTFLDPATGQTITNYLYLNDDIAGGASTNVQIFNGFPDNFTLTESSTPLLTNSSPSGPDLPYVNIFPPGGVTNNFAYVDFSGDSTSETNANASNPSGALTNVPARIQITGSRELNLSLAQISGQLYTSLTATNQFDGSPGAQIASPYTDINLGVTNGTLTISNLLEARFLNWSGTIQCWSTRWLITGTNLLGSFTNDYRVVIVSSQLNPITAAQVQNLKLNATNVVISDTLNVFGALNVSAQSMTLTTNAVGNGASSLEGELNLEDADTTSWSWNGAFPNLLWLTNNGVIIVPNFSDFIGSSNVVTITSNTPAVQASATLSGTGSTNYVTTNVTVSVGATTYTFTNNITSKAPPNYVKVGPNFDASMTNLIAAINQGTGEGTVYSSNTFANSTATAGPLSAHAFTVSAGAIYPGTSGNGIIPVATSANPTNLAWSGSVLTGGVNGIPGSTNASPTSVPYAAIINSGLLADQGSTIWVNNFVNGGMITNGAGSFILTAQTATLTNGSLTAGGDVSIAANTLEVSNLMLLAGSSLTLQVTNSLTDDGVTNGNIWTIGSSNGTGGNGLVLPLLPTNTSLALPFNNLLGTTISMTVPAPNKLVSSTWAGLDYGVSTIGYMTNNVAIGQLILDSLAPSSDFYFAGTGGPGVSNAIYVDRLVLNDYASYTNGLGTEQIPTLLFNSNLTIYYADAVASGEDVSYQLNKSNGGHLRWVPQYTGYFSSTNVVYPNGTTNTLNAGLVESPFLDSNGNGTPNAFDPEPIFLPSQVNFKFALTNVPPMMAVLTWDSIPSATNTIYYTTNMMMSTWLVETNFVSPSTTPPAGGWPITNIVIEPLHPSPHGFYRVRVSPNSADEYGQ